MPRYPYKRSYSARSSPFYPGTATFRPNSYRRTAGSYKRKTNPVLRTAVQSILNQNTETKYYDVSDENKELYHNVGESNGIPLITTPYSNTTFFNPWADIPPGTGRANRILKPHLGTST
jgi:hypothetical protein